MARANEGLEEAFHADPRLDVGGQTDIRFAVDRNRICEIINISRAIVDKDGLEHVVNGYTRTNGTGPGREVYDRTITIPETVPPGKAWYYIRLRYGCNVLNFRGWPIVVESPRVPLPVWPKVDKGWDYRRRWRQIRQAMTGEWPGVRSGGYLVTEPHTAR